MTAAAPPTAGRRTGRRDPLRSPLDDVATTVGILVVAGLAVRLHRPVEEQLRALRRHPTETLQNWIDVVSQSAAGIVYRREGPARHGPPAAGEAAEGAPLVPAA